MHPSSLVFYLVGDNSTFSVSQWCSISMAFIIICKIMHLKTCADM